MIISWTKSKYYSKFRLKKVMKHSWAAIIENFLESAAHNELHFHGRRRQNQNQCNHRIIFALRTWDRHLDVLESNTFRALDSVIWTDEKSLGALLFSVKTLLAEKGADKSSPFFFPADVEYRQYVRKHFSKLFPPLHHRRSRLLSRSLDGSEFFFKLRRMFPSLR